MSSFEGAAIILEPNSSSSTTDGGGELRGAEKKMDAVPELLSNDWNAWLGVRILGLERGDGRRMLLRYNVGGGRVRTGGKNISDTLNCFAMDKRRNDYYFLFLIFRCVWEKGEVINYNNFQAKGDVGGFASSIYVASTYPLQTICKKYGSFSMNEPISVLDIRSPSPSTSTSTFSSFNNTRRRGVLI
ncbi:hypothetical protein Salat_0651100 [Sesamum alatum]|uniref:Uncharacterized protein n=1 Tax=Sesamum alatum TaxID=300844 RepID=A0AAE2CUD7_9LAMI|nr:hypothetical protein Salat_0651100 [Sesamum alatum]